MKRNFKIATRLMILVAIMSICFFFITILGIRGISTNIEHLRSVYEGGADTLYYLYKIERSVGGVLEVVNKKNSQRLSWEETDRQIQDEQNTMTKNWAEYLHTEGANAEAENLRDDLSKVLTRFQEIIASQNQEEFQTFASHQIIPKIDKMQEFIDREATEHLKQTFQDYTAAKERSQNTMWMLLISAIVVIILALIFSYLIIKSITRPLGELVDALNKVAVGETDVTLKINSKDEIGLLAEATQNMISATQKMVLSLENVAQGDLTVNVPTRSSKDLLGNAINNMAARLKTTIGEVLEQVHVIAASIEEIVASVTQVSAGTAETATAVTETTTTVEELKQTAHVSAEKAQDVLTSAEETRSVVHSSEETVSATIQDMTQIQDKMRIISESIVTLSEHTLVIGEIIESVNDLAEQSNLLAVNAAIEAAKAGEQGKSFSVVAQEIRALAEQSKAATVQVRSILNDIQNATSSVVMATEQGSKAVAKGVEQSSQTTVSIQSLLESMEKVTLAAKQISISSQQQLIGVDQVTIAMNNINESSNQHVEHMRQIQSAVSSLDSVVRSLKELMTQYRLQQKK